MTYYAEPDFKTKGDLKRAVQNGRVFGVYSAGLGTVPLDGEVTISGPKYPKPHAWYAIVVLRAGLVVKVKS